MGVSSDNSGQSKGSNFLRSMAPLPLFLGRSNGNSNERKLSSKEKKYKANIERALASFDSVEEWADYISFLGKLQRALQTNPDRKNNHWIPHEFDVSGLLAQCISPNLPGGVHLKAIEVYTDIFDILGPTELSKRTQIWIPGILPLMAYASINVKPSVLKIYKEYLGRIEAESLRISFKPILLSLLPALDDVTSEFFSSIMNLIDMFRTNLNNDTHFWQCMFLCIITSSDKRGGAMQYCQRKLPNFTTPKVVDKTGEKHTDKNSVLDHLSQEIKDCVTPEAGLLFRAFASGLLDTNVLVQRGFFDILLSKMPLNSPVLQNIAGEKDRELLIMSVANTALRKDMSLNRRLWNWLLGGEESAIGMSLTSGSSEHPGNDESISRSQYFHKFGYKYFLHSIISLIEGTSSSEPKYLQVIEACQICVAIMDRWEIGQRTIYEVFVPIIRVVAKGEKSLDADKFGRLLRAASAFFDGIDSETIWYHLYELIKKGEIDLVYFTVQNFHINDEDMLMNHIPYAALAILCYTPNEFEYKWIRLYEELLSLLSFSAISMEQSSKSEYFEYTNKCSEPDFKQGIIKKIDNYYEPFKENKGESANLENDLGGEDNPSQFSPLDFTCLYLSFIENKASISVKERNSAAFYAFCEALNQLTQKISIDALCWKDETLLQSIEKIDVESFAIDDAPTAFGCALVFEYVTKTLSTIHIIETLKVVVTLLWKCLIHFSGKYQVEAAKNLWSLRESVKPKYIEACLSKLFLASDTVSRIRTFNILWTQSTLLNGMDSILVRPLHIILDDLKSDSHTDNAFIVNWLRASMLSGTLNRIFKICCKGLLTDYNFILDGEFANNESDDFGIFKYDLNTLYNLLTASEQGVHLAFKSELCVIDTDLEMKTITANNWNISTYKSLVLTVIQRFLSIKPPTNLDNENFQLYCSCVQLCLSLIKLLVDGSEKNFEAIFNLLVHTSETEVKEDRNHILNAYTLETIVDLMKLSSKKQLEVSIFETSKDSSKGSRFLEFIENGISKSVSPDQIHSWLNLILQTSDYFSELVFTVISGLTTCIINKIQEQFKTFSSEEQIEAGKDRNALIDTDDDICELVNGLQEILQKSHRYLGYLTSGNFVYGNANNAENSNKDPGFFGAMIQGVFQVEEPTYKDELYRRRVLLLKSLKKSVEIVYHVWSWTDEDKNSDEETQTAISSMSVRSNTYRASKLRFRCKKFLVSMYSDEPLETLETLIDCRKVSAGATNDAERSMKIFHILDGEKDHKIVKYIINSLMSRVSITSLVVEERASLLTTLSEKSILLFFKLYMMTLGNEVLEESWTPIFQLLKEACSGYGGYKKLFPDILEFAAIICSKRINLSFGDQKKIKREVDDTFLKILNTVISNKMLLQTSQSNSSVISPSASPKSELGFSVKFESVKERSKHLPSSNNNAKEDLCPILAKVVPMISQIMSDEDKLTTCLTTIVSNVVEPLVKPKSSLEKTPPTLLDLLQALSTTKESFSLKAWKSLCVDILTGDHFFSSNCWNLDSWNAIFAKWIQDDPDKLLELIRKLSAYAGTNAPNIFNWNDTESNAGIMDLKRICYLLMVCPKDAFIMMGPRLQSQISGLLRSTNAASLKPYIYMMIRVIIITFSEVHLSTFWPTVYTELEATFQKLLEKLLELKFDDDVLGVEHEKLDLSAFDNNLILQACKLLDCLLILGPEEFQLDEWLFINDNADAVYGREDLPLISVIDKIASIKSLKVIDSGDTVKITSDIMDSKLKRPLLQGVKKIDKVFELRPFFERLRVFKYENDYAMKGVNTESIWKDMMEDLFN